MCTYSTIYSSIIELSSAGKIGFRAELVFNWNQIVIKANAINVQIRLIKYLQIVHLENIEIYLSHAQLCMFISIANSIILMHWLVTINKEQATLWNIHYIAIHEDSLNNIAREEVNARFSIMFLDVLQNRFAPQNVYKNMIQNVSSLSRWLVYLA